MTSASSDAPMLRPAQALTVLVFCLVPFLWITGCAGLFFPHIYDGFMLPQHVRESQGQDLVTLAVAVPLLLVGLSLLRKGQLRGALLLTGTFMYTAYTMILYAYGGVYNYFLLAYIACLSLSVWGIIPSLSAVDVSRVPTLVKQEMPRRPVAVFLFAAATVFSLMWISIAIGSIAAGDTNEGNLVFVTDLAFVVPAYLLGGVWMWQGRAWGYVLCGALLVKANLLFGSIVVGQLMRLAFGDGTGLGVIAMFVAFGLASFSLFLSFQRNLLDEPAVASVTVPVRPWQG